MIRPAAALLLAVLPAAPTLAHDWYGTLRNPTSGALCCNHRDCRPVDYCVTSGGREGIMVEGTCRTIDPTTVLRMPSPDGKAHACWLPNPDTGEPVIRCVILGGMS